jgi:hypothetical protein
MEGRRFGAGLAAGLLVALALVVVSGGLGATPFTALLAPSGTASPSSSTTVATLTFTMSTTTTPQAAILTSTASATTSAPPGSLVSNVTTPYQPSTTTFGTVSSTITTSTLSNQNNQSAATAATNANGTPYYAASPSGTNKPTRLASIAQQPIVSKAEILAPVLIAFFLGAFLYRVAVQERERRLAQAD